MELDNHYKVLGLAPGSPLAQVKKTYLREIKTWHPDRYAPNSILREQAEERTKALTAAYAALCATLKAQAQADTSPPVKTTASVGREPFLGSAQNHRRTSGQWLGQIWQHLKDTVHPIVAIPVSAARRSGRSQSCGRAKRAKRSAFNEVLDAARSQPGERADNGVAWLRLAAKRSHYRSRHRGLGATSIDPIRAHGPVTPVRSIRPIGQDD